MSKILRLNAGFMLKLTVFYFIGISRIFQVVEPKSFKSQKEIHLEKTFNEIFQS
ncbi:hypothetical protein [Leptospira weilii]|uniref:hypothetical protein n=1 Tax=Leptospira weilii TaxID=28184 RepID=UPI000AE38CAE|nr:hypothetical protein [Leptospira weilii]